MHAATYVNNTNELTLMRWWWTGLALLFLHSRMTVFAHADVTAASVRICNAPGVVTAIDIDALRWLMFATFNSNKYDEDDEATNN